MAVAGMRSDLVCRDETIGEGFWNIYLDRFWLGAYENNPLLLTPFRKLYVFAQEAVPARDSVVTIGH